MRGYAQAFRDLPTFLLICRHLTRSVDISRPAPSNSLALFNDNPRKLYLDSRQLALYNIYMKKRKTFDMNKYLAERNEAHKEHCKAARMIIGHPAFWLFSAIVITYSCGL